jgi:hypothetical protein
LFYLVDHVTMVKTDVRTENREPAIMAIVEQWELRAEFARRLSVMYGKKVPAYTTLLHVSHEVNRDVLSARGANAARLGVRGEIEIPTTATATEGHLQ